eukprot:CAMPEP_0119014058 /NCGR_PEP_ID=MMETSP1176-20130426/9333_1 /TAXON_ID=265551 /ORGANISM="Synedropsis recta cf, Strain CCMP1620" /LENGTH=121 /DNA_ID=CAMNT_0006967195 /DNA_START=19 /DNA_END=384 /DNA_ORIENTATION=+
MEQTNRSIMGGTSIPYNAVPVAEVVDAAEQQPCSSFVTRTSQTSLACIGTLMCLVVGSTLYSQHIQHRTTASPPTSYLRPHADQPEPDDYFHQFDPSSRNNDYEYPEMHDSEGQPLEDAHP